MDYSLLTHKVSEYRRGVLHDPSKKDIVEARYRLSPQHIDWMANGLIRLLRRRGLREGMLSATGSMEWQGLQLTELACRRPTTTHLSPQDDA